MKNHKINFHWKNETKKLSLASYYTWVPLCGMSSWGQRVPPGVRSDPSWLWWCKPSKPESRLNLQTALSTDELVGQWRDQASPHRHAPSLTPVRREREKHACRSRRTSSACLLAANRHKEGGWQGVWSFSPVPSPPWLPRVVFSASFPQRLRSRSGLPGPLLTFTLSIPYCMKSPTTDATKRQPSETTKVHECLALASHFGWNLWWSLCQMSKVVSISLLHFSTHHMLLSVSGCDFCFTSSFALSTVNHMGEKCTSDRLYKAVSNQNNGIHLLKIRSRFLHA